MGAHAIVLLMLAAAQPSGSAQVLLNEACVQCHDLRIIASQRKTAAAWRRTVNEMVWKGAPLLPGEAARLTEYLSRTFGPRSASK